MMYWEGLWRAFCAGHAQDYQLPWFQQFVYRVYGCRSSFPVNADLCSTIEPDTDLASCPDSVFIDSGSREGQCSQ